MGKTGTRKPTTILTVAIATLLVVSAVGMGVRQLLREGVFSETKPIAQKQPAKPAVPLVKQPPSAEAPDNRIRADQQPEQDTSQAPAEPQPATKETPTPRPMPDRQPPQRADSTPNLSREQQDELNYQYIQAIWPSLSEQDREEARRVMQQWPTMSEEERDYYRRMVETLQ
mgnify:CR=1 FL=1